MRAIAVLAVVLFHAGIGPTAGFVGVDVFFVISGYLITSLLLTEWRHTGRIGFIDFYARRARRIVPAAVVVVLATLLVSWVLLPPSALIQVAESSAAANVFAANFFFQSVTGGYFDQRASEMPLLHLWSLSVEEQFYLAWPALLIFSLRQNERSLPAVLMLLVLASISLSEFMLQTNTELAFYQMPPRVWEFCFGGLVAISPRLGTRTNWIAAAAVGGLILSTFASIEHFPGLGAMPAVATSAIVLWLIHGNSAMGLAGKWLRSRPMVTIGKLSYSFYLWHWPLLALYSATTIGDGDSVVRVSLVVLALVLAAATYRYVEQPFRRLKWRSSLTVLSAVLLSLALAAGALFWAKSLRYSELIRPSDNPFAAFVEADQPAGWRRCHYIFSSKYFPIHGCESVPGVVPRVVMWGDSMAMSWRPLAWQLGHLRSVSAVDYSRDGCPPILDYLPADPTPGDMLCKNHNSVVAASLGPDQTVILVMRMGNLSNDELLVQLSKSIEKISSRVSNVIVLGPTPEMADSVPKCIRSGRLDACAISRNAFDAKAFPRLQFLRTTVAGIPNTYVIDTSRYFCTESTCPPVKDGIGLYWDSHHVSATAAANFSSEIAHEIAGSPNP